jgi:hypothetical protein
LSKATACKLNCKLNNKGHCLQAQVTTTKAAACKINEEFKATACNFLQVSLNTSGSLLKKQSHHGQCLLLGGRTGQLTEERDRLLLLAQILHTVHGRKGVDARSGWTGEKQQALVDLRAQWHSHHLYS